MPTLQEPIATISKLDLKVINFLDKLIFTTRRTSKPISSVNIDIKSNNLPNQDKDSKRSTTIYQQIKLVYYLAGIDLYRTYQFNYFYYFLVLVYLRSL